MASLDELRAPLGAADARQRQLLIAACVLLPIVALLGLRKAAQGFVGGKPTGVQLAEYSRVGGASPRRGGAAADASASGGGAPGSAIGYQVSTNADSDGDMPDV